MKPTVLFMVIVAVVAVSSPAQPQVISADGIVESTVGGFKFPDGSMQAKAAANGSYENVIVVAKSGGDFTSIQSAIDSITDSVADNRYLVYVAPGIYSERVVMKPYVDVQGAGKSVTKITAPGSSGIGDPLGTVRGANHSSLSSLTVENTGSVEDTGPAERAVGILNLGTSPRLHDLKVIMVGEVTYGKTGISSEGSPAHIDNVEVMVSGPDQNMGVSLTGSSGTCAGTVVRSLFVKVVGGASSGTNTGIAVECYDAEVDLLFSRIEVLHEDSGFAQGIGFSAGQPLNVRNSSIIASGQSSSIGFKSVIQVDSHSVRIDNSQITGETATIDGQSDLTLGVGASLLAGGAVAANGGTITCAGVYNEDYILYTSSCP